MSTPKFPVTVKRGSASVKIYRGENKGYPVFTMAYHDGAERRRETFTSFDEAKLEAEAVATKLCRGELDVLTLTSADRLLYVRATEALKPTGIPLDTAVADFAMAHKRLTGTPLQEAVEFYVKRHPQGQPKKTVTEVVEELIIHRRERKASYHYVNDLKKLRSFATSFQCPIASVSGQNVDDWLMSLKVADRTRNNYRRLVSTLFSFAKTTRKYLPFDHDEMSSVHKSEETPGEIEIFTPGEMSAILSEADNHLVPFLAIGAFAGVRHWEIKRLDWSKVNLKTGFIEITGGKSKTGMRRLIPILPNLHAWLLPHAQASGPVCSYQNMSEELMYFSNARGIPWKRNGLRHSFVSYRLAQIQNVNQVALECGNSPGVIFKNYRELVQPSDADKWFAITPTTTEKIISLPAAVHA